MGKKARKTRWRALPIDTGNQSDSEESNAYTGPHANYNNKNNYYHQNYSQSHHYNNNTSNNHQHCNNYQQSQYYGGVQRSYRAGSKFSTFASGQTTSTMRGRFGQYHRDQQQKQHQQPHHNNDSGSKTTSTTTLHTNGAATTTTNATDSKIIFNEDEYTRITTPRQDVLFKKGYLSKPKTYQTQTSTGNSTISTGNSTGNGTPDHQSADGTEGTDLEYESQFVFSNGFVDQNGIYYINSYEPYPPLVVYNPQMCYPEYVQSTRTKRLSTGSLTESTSPHNEETSQELSHSGGETVNNYPEFGSHMYNVVFPGYFYGNGVPQEMELSEPRKMKKRRRRKLSKPIPEDNWTTSSSDDYDESEEMVSEIENRIIQGTHRPPTADTPPTPEDKDATVITTSNNGENKSMPNGVQCAKEHRTGAKMALKPDAKEFVPRSFIHRHHHHQLSPPFIANLMPLPPPFLPPPMHKPPSPLQPHHLNVAVIPSPPPSTSPTTSSIITTPTEQNNNDKIESKEEVVIALETKQDEPAEIAAETSKDKNVDIAKIVSKLEEAAKEQGTKLQKARPKRRPLPIAFNVDTKHSTIKVDAVTSKIVFHNSSVKNYAQMLRNKDNETMRQSCNRTSAMVGSSKNQSKSGAANNAAHLVNVVQGSQQPVQKSQNQWIPVHSRKKRKNNKNPQEADWDDTEEEVSKNEDVIFTETAIPLAEDGFEVYDVTKLEDVIVPKEPGVSAEAKEDNKPEVPEPKISITPNVNETEKVEGDPLKMSDTQKAAEEEEFDKLIKTLEELEAKTSSKKKAKPVTGKRVIVTDVTEITPPLVMEEKVTVKKSTLQKPKTLKNKSKHVKELTVEVIQSSSSVTEVLGCQPKISANISSLADEANLAELNQPNDENPIVETVSKLIPEVVVAEEEVPMVMPVPVAENATCKERDGATDDLVKISQPIIETQTSDSVESPEKKRKKKKKASKKLLAPNVEGQIVYSDEANYDFLITESILEDERTNVEIFEELDKIIQRGMYSSLEEKIKSLNITAANDGFFKSMSLVSSHGKKAKEDDLSSILTNTTNIFKGKRTLSHQNEPTTTGSFLDVANIQQDPGIDCNRSSMLGMEEYPITKAVKDWMVRTRETTPEVELLKSPRTIIKELARPITDDGKLPLEERAIKESWSLTPESSFDDDLLECWDDLEVASKLVANEEDVEHVELAIGEEVRSEGESLEVYESMYGKNEDFKKIREEIEEKRRNGTLPKYGHLPYRAICCSLM